MWGNPNVTDNMKATVTRKYEGSLDMKVCTRSREWMVAPTS
jgi:hypothetical protein